MTFKEAIEASPIGRADYCDDGFSAFLSNQDECGVCVCISFGYIEPKDLLSTRWTPAEFKGGEFAKYSDYKYKLARRYLKSQGVSYDV